MQYQLFIFSTLWNEYHDFFLCRSNFYFRKYIFFVKKYSVPWIFIYILFIRLRTGKYLLELDSTFNIYVFPITQDYYFSVCQSLYKVYYCINNKSNLEIFREGNKILSWTRSILPNILCQGRKLSIERKASWELSRWFFLCMLERYHPF